MSSSLFPAGDFLRVVSNQKVHRCKRILTDKDRSSPLCEMRAGTKVPLAVRMTERP